MTPVTSADVPWLRRNDPRTPMPATGERLRFLTAAELRAHAPAEPPWLLEGYIAAGSLTLLAGKPKVGKSTLALALAEAIALGSPTLLGRRVDGGPVVYVSEEATATLLHKLPGGDVRFLTRDLTWPMPSWEALNAAVVDEARRVDAKLIVFDTFAHWAALAAEREKDSGAMQAAMATVLDATRHGLAVLLLHHQRKAGGEGGEGIRGSGAIAGAADVVLELERTGKRDEERQRNLFGLSRYPQTPGVLLLDYNAAERSWREVGQGDGRREASTIAWRERLLAALGDAGQGATYSHLETVLGRQKKDWLKTLNDLISEGLVTPSGRGVKGDPLQFDLALGNSITGFRSSTEQERTGSTESAVPSFHSPEGGEMETESDYEKPFESPQADRNGSVVGERTLADLTDAELLDADRSSNLANADDSTHAVPWDLTGGVVPWL